MTSPQFLARFKEKSSTLDRTGNIDVTFSKPVEISPNQRLPPVDRDITPLRSKRSEIHLLRANTHISTGSHLSPRLKTLTPMRFGISRSRMCEVGVVTPTRAIYEDRREFVPYTLEEYTAITPKSYWTLGSLGPSHIGAEDWELATKQSSLKRAYGRAAQIANLRGRGSPERVTPVRGRGEGEGGKEEQRARARLKKYFPAVKRNAINEG